MYAKKEIKKSHLIYYSITRLNRILRGLPFYFGSEIVSFKKITVKTYIKGPEDFLQFNKRMPKRGISVHSFASRTLTLIYLSLILFYDL